MSEKVAAKLSDAQIARIQRNKLKAQSLRQAKLVSHPYAETNKKVECEKRNDIDTSSIINVHGTKYVDSGGGFLVEQELLPGNSDNTNKNNNNTKLKTPQNEAINIPITFEECLECGDAFADSFLLTNFKYAVCDKCRDPDGKHSLITRSEAKTEYLLKDCDFDRREPPLRYIQRRNPHNVRWGEMKLYLHLQIEERALEVWGSEEELQRQHESRDEKREVTKIRKYNKQLKALRMEIRSSLFTKKTYETHTHTFGTETYNEEDDNYTHTCTECNFTETFEKM